MVESTPSFGQRLRRLRLAAGLSQEELAERAGLTAAAIGALERGERRHPYPHTLRALAGALGLSAADRAALFAAVPARGSGGESAAGAQSKTALGHRSLPPLPPTPLVGRAREVAVVTGLFHQGQARLVTLTGPGGVGKTRLAIEVAGYLRSSFADGPVWVDLAPVQEPDLVPPTITRALGLPEQAGQDIAEMLAGYLGRGPQCLVLDNFEHLLDSAPLVSALLGRCPQLWMLITSREALRVRGEHEVQVPPLDVPELESGASAERVARSEAATLFLQRVRAVRPGFDLTDADAPFVAAICARLDGLPLALELAAVQLKYMSPAVLLDRLRSQLALFEGGPRDLPARQRSLRATVAWSHELLTEPEQVTFRRLAVFAGGFSADAVGAVCGVGDCQAKEITRTLAALVDKSLVQAIPDAGESMRFAMLETIREYARERLVASGEESLIAGRHVDYFCDLAEAAAPHLSSAARGPWLRHLDVEVANLRAALAWTTTKGDPCVGLRLAGALGWFWILQTYIDEGTRWTDRLLASPTESCAESARAGALYAAAGMAWKRGDLPIARRYAEESVALRRSLGDGGLAFALAVLGLVATAEGDLERARRFQEESLSLFRGQDDRWGIAYALANLGDVLLKQGDLSGARRHYDESLARFSDVNDAWGRGIVLHALGNIALASSDAATARAHYEVCVALFRGIGNRENIGRSLIGLAAATLSEGKVDEARRLLTESIAIWRDFRSKSGIALCLAGLAGVKAAQGNIHAAARLFGAAETHARGLAPLYLVDADLFARYSRAMRELLGDELVAHAWAEGQAMTLDQAVQVALAEDVC